jgi:hypothetical protein
MEITTTTNGTNPTNLVARRMADQRLTVGGGMYCYLNGWGVYNTAIDAWLTFTDCVVTAGNYTARKPYLLDRKKVAAMVANGGLNGTNEWLTF